MIWWPPRVPTSASPRIGRHIVGTDVLPAYYGTETPRHIQCASIVAIAVYIYFDGIVMAVGTKDEEATIQPAARGRVTYVIVNPNNEETYFRYTAMPVQDYLDAGG